MLGIPRGGLVVAAEIARALRAPLDVALARKVGAPQNPEFAVGAVAEGAMRVLHPHSARALGLSRAQLDVLIAGVEGQLEDQVRHYRAQRPRVSLEGASAILVDDGLATGCSALAASRSLRDRGAARVILAVPVAAASGLEALREELDECVCLQAAEEMWAVGLWYESFSAPSDEQLAALLTHERAGATRQSGR